MEDSREIVEALLASLRKESPRESYRTLRFVLTRLVEVALRGVPLQFSGLFAKTNYLLTRHGASWRLIRSVGNARQRIRRLDGIRDDEELRLHLPYDAKALAAFLHLLFPDEKLPDELTRDLPEAEPESRRTPPQTDCRRIIVTGWDADHITGRADEGDAPELRVCYSEANRYLLGDCSYLTRLLSEGCQLNLVRPRQEAGTLFPELIVYEPDFLVDISSVASGVKEYGLTPLTRLISKLSPSSATRATLLGDFASQLLSEELHGQSNRPYAESIGHFCRKRALALAACGDLDSSFHDDARRQKVIIHRAMSEDLPKAVDGFEASDAILEPSFCCEMLGLQGRMDLLSRDRRVLMEQKSGKAQFVSGQRGLDTPTPATPHYVQLLLYRALLHYNFNLPNEQIRPFLLYSKYERPLVQTDSMPKLLNRAFMLRNQMVWAELYYAREGFGLLKTLRAEDLNKEGITSKIWTDYIAPGIENALQPVREASELERAYHQAMLRFVQREYVLEKIGDKRKENSGFAARWHDSLEVKKEAGNIIDGMSLEIQGQSLILHLPTPIDSNFRTGDIVTLFPYRQGREPDCRHTIVHRATIERIGGDTITLHPRMAQADTSIFDTQPGWSWAMEHDFLEAGFASLFRGIHSFLSSTCQRRDLVLTQRKPSVDRSLTLKGEYGQFNELSLRVKQAKELFLIVGPPGTGKTSYGMLNTLKEELFEPESSVAVMAYTNRAVDEICSKLVGQGIDFTRIGSHLSCSPEYKPYMLSNRVAGFSKVSDIREFIVSQRIVVGTTAAFNNSNAIFSLRGFSLAIVDEASQILEPHLLGLLSAMHGAEEAIRKFVLIGDHKQLPAVVHQTSDEAAVSDPLLRGMGLTDCRQSLFERLLRQYRDDPEVVYVLSRQGRMHEQIAAFSNEMFYGRCLSCVPLPHQTEPSEEPRVTFIDVAPRPETPSDKINSAEAEVIAGIVKNLDHTLTVGIIVPYRNQISAIRNALAAVSCPLSGITIDTVERFQGSQRDVIIYGFTVRRPYQLDFLTDNCFLEDGHVIDRKLNVVMTRAMRRLILVGNRQLLCRNPLFRKLINQIER